MLIISKLNLRYYSLPNSINNTPQIIACHYNTPYRDCILYEVRPILATTVTPANLRTAQNYQLLPRYHPKQPKPYTLLHLLAMPPVYSVSTIVLLPDLCNNYKLKQCCSRNNRKIIDSHSTRAMDQGSPNASTTNTSTAASAQQTSSSAAYIALETVAITPPATPCKDRDQHHPEQQNLSTVDDVEIEPKPISRSRGRGSYKKRRKRKK